MRLRIVAAGGEEAEFLSLLSIVSDVNGCLPERYASLGELKLAIDRQLCDVLFLDVAAFEESVQELGTFLLELTQSGRVRRLVVSCEGGFPVALADRFELLEACWLELPANRNAVAEALAGEKHFPDRYSPREERVMEAGGARFATRTPELFPVLNQLRRIAPHNVTLLLVGETGSGKTHLAQLIHNLSPRSAERFMATPCGALPKDLIESELFGHVRGAFTGADRAKIGRFEAAGKGTLLLDEIDVLSPNEQSKLLQVIETGEFQPVGATESRLSTARLIAASNVDLKYLVNEGEFRSDLYYRLNVLEFRLPPLRQRPFDIFPLAMQFIQEASDSHGIAISHVDPRFLNMLLQHAWPGNVRELRNQMRRVVLFSQDGVITRETLSPGILGLEEGVAISDVSGNTRPVAPPPELLHVPAAPPAADAPDWEIGNHLCESEKQFLVAALNAHENNRSATARALGISRVGLYKKLRRLGLHLAEGGTIPAIAPATQ